MTLVIRLESINLHAVFGPEFLQRLFDVSQCGTAVQVWFAGAEEVEVGPVENED